MKKIILKTGPKNQAFSTRQKGSKRYRDAKLLRNPLFCSVSRVSTSTAVLPQDSRPESRKKGFQEGWPKKRAKNLENGHFAKMSISRFSRHRRFSAKTGHPISHYKTSGFGRPGPLINSSRAAY